MFAIASTARGALAVVAVVASLATSACASQGQLDQATGELVVERARRRAAEAASARLREKLAATDARLMDAEQKLSAAQLEAELAGRGRASAEATAEQLRLELSRIAEHIRHFANRNTELEGVGQRLEAMEQDVEHRLTTLGELTARLGHSPASSGVVVMVKDGYPAVRFAAGSAVSPAGLSKEGRLAIAALAAVVERRGTTELIALHLPGDAAGRSVAEAVAEAVRIRVPSANVEVLEAEGVERGTALAIVRRGSVAAPAG